MSEWKVVKAADSLRPGDRFIFGDDMGGEGEVLTVEGTADSFGTIEIATEEKDFTIEANFNQMITLATEKEEA
jgi:hypothetical protein